MRMQARYCWSRSISSFFNGRFLAEFIAKHQPDVERKTRGLAAENALPNDTVMLLSEIEDMLDAATHIVVQPCDGERTFHLFHASSDCFFDGVCSYRFLEDKVAEGVSVRAAMVYSYEVLDAPDIYYVAIE